MTDVYRPVIPREVAEAIEKIRSEHGDDLLFDIEGMGKLPYDKETYPAYCFANDRPRQYFAAIINGYEVEKTPEEQIREMYEKNNKEAKYSPWSDGYANGVIDTLDALGIKIEGVNV